VSHANDLAAHELDHLVAELWTLDTGGAATVDEVKSGTRVEDLDGAIDRLVDRGLARIDGRSIVLSGQGRTMAERLVRRHRLAEMLFTSVLDVADDSTVNRTACVMEHVLSASVTDSVCSFLGHPKFCPHGKPIPAGACCRSFSNAVEPLVQPLDQLAVGRSGKIVYIVPRDPARLVRLSDLGLVPGVIVKLQQHRPAMVIGVGETTLAIDSEIATEIYVKKVE
jgi:DtxR family Mn-dependent transcriptional regulator